MINRTITNQILQTKDNKKCTIIIGPRQVGKTTILKHIQSQLKGLFLDIDIYSNYEKVSTYESFINTLILNNYQKSQKHFFYVFLDEFQRYPDLTKVFKNIYDNHSNIKIFATGSSSLAIKNSIQESLAGRKKVINLFPLNFKEFLTFKDQKHLIEKIDQLDEIQTKNYSLLVPELLTFFHEYLVYGGYPEVVLSPIKEKQEVFESIFDLYLKKDLIDFLKTEKIKNIKTLIQQIAINNGGMANYSRLSQICSIDSKTVVNYFEILKETFLINIINPFFSNKNKEITKAPKLYFLDNGVRNFFYNNFNPIDLRNDSGILFEGYFISELLKNGENIDNIKYYRTKNKTEVDIILDLVSKIIPIEIKYKKQIKTNDLNNLNSFMKEYSIKNGYLVNMGEIDKAGSIQKVNCFQADPKYFLE